MRIFHYHPATGEFISESEARLSPKDAEEGREVYLLPAHATEIASPEIGPNEAAVFDGQKWSTVPDHRGEVDYDPNTGARRLIEALGDAPVISEPPPDGLYKPRWDGQAWIENEDPAVVRKQIEAQAIDLTLRRDAARAAGYTIEADLQAELDAVEAKLAMLEGK